MKAPKDPIDDPQTESSLADHGTPSPGVDRRTFMALSLAATAAGTFGIATARAQVAGAVADGRAQAAQQPPPPPVPLGNGEAPALQFQPYPGGTGAMMEKLARERGRAAFDRSVFVVEPWRGRCPPRRTTSRFSRPTGSPLC